MFKSIFNILQKQGISKIGFKIRLVFHNFRIFKKKSNKTKTQESK